MLKKAYIKPLVLVSFRNRELLRFKIDALDLVISIYAKQE
jgi:hypothetical protein